MAQGDLLLFNEFSKDSLEAIHDLTTGGNTVKVALITTLPVITQTTPTLGDFTEVSGAGYTAGGETISTNQDVTVVSGPQYKYDSSDNPSWNQNGSGPTNVVAGVIYNDTDATGPDKALGFVDMTVDGGVTPVSLQAGNISITWNASGIFLHG